MGACASRFSVLKSAEGKPPPPEELASRDFNSAEKKLQPDVGKPVVAEDEPKRQLLGNLLKEAETASGVKENNGEEFLEVKQEQVKPQEDESVKPATESLVAAAELKSQEEVNEGQDVKPVSKDGESAVSKGVTEEKSVETTNLAMEKPDEIEKPCLETTVEDKPAVEDAKETGVVVKEVGTPCSEKHETGMMIAEAEKEEQKPASAEMETKTEIEIRTEEKDDEKPASVKEVAIENKEAETSEKLEVHGTEKLETQETCDDDQEPVKTIEVEVEKLATVASDVEKKKEKNETTAAGTETSKKSEADQPEAAVLATEKLSDDNKPEVKSSS